MRPESQPATGALRLNSGEARYHRLGRGPDLLMLHGLLGWGTQWLGCAERLASQFTCWLPELPGISASSPVPDSSLPGLRLWLEQVVDGLGLRQFNLAASSWGGALALEYAMASSQRGQIRRMLLAAPAHPFWRPSARQRFLLTPFWTRPAALIGQKLPFSVYRNIMGSNFAHPERIGPDRVAKYREILCQPGLGRAVAAYARHWQRDQQRLGQALAGVTTDTLLVWGSRDRVVPVVTAEPLRRSLPRAELVLLDDLGHLPFEEAPELFATTLARFLA